MDIYYKIGEFAVLCGIPKSTLAYYAKINLLKPHHIGENGYFYYAPSQIYHYELIASLREMDVSLEDIQNYLENQNVEHCLEILKKNMTALEERQRHLERIKCLMNATIQETEEAMQIETCQFEIVELEDEYYFTYHMPYRTEDAVSDLKDARKLINYCKHNFYNGTLNVSEIVLQKDIENGSFRKTYGAFRLRNWKEDMEQVSKNVFLRPRGTYATVAMRASGEEIPEIYRKLCIYARDQGYHVCGNGYEEDLLSYMMEHNRSHYLVRCYIQIEKNVY